MRDPLPVRLGGLAPNLSRVKSFSRNEINRAAVFDLFDESKFFIEWTALEAEIDVTIELIELQLQIAIWQRAWNKNWADENERNAIALKAAEWSQRILVRSGLLSGRGV